MNRNNDRILGNICREVTTELYNIASIFKLYCSCFTCYLHLIRLGRLPQSISYHIFQCLFQTVNIGLAVLIVRYGIVGSKHLQRSVHFKIANAHIL